MGLGDILMVVGSLVLTGLAGYSAVIMLYAWEDEDKRGRNVAPGSFEPPRMSFTVMLPARHEEAVIQETIQRVADLNYPRHLVEGLVVIESGDHGTIARVNEKLDELSAAGIRNIRLITFSDPPINKPHGLNVALHEASGDIVTIFDAEDEPHPDILQIVNTVAHREGVPVVQCGVQLMNYADYWFSSLNVLEYFFWFKSRLHYHANKQIVPLGGNTVFVRRVLLEELNGWDQECLTEDADLGIRLSAAGVPIRIVYDDRYVTREETPHSVSQFIKQRTRWNQGFLQVLFKGDWKRLPTLTQRLLALYTLTFPLAQALMFVYVPLSVWSMLFVKVPEAVAMVTMLPLYMLLAQLAINLVGLYEFAGVHGLRPSRLSPLRLIVAYLPFQWLLSYAAIRAVWRHVTGDRGWEKTTHIGAHRTAELAVPASNASASRRRDEVLHG